MKDVKVFVHENAFHFNEQLGRGAPVRGDYGRLHLCCLLDGRRGW